MKTHLSLVITALVLTLAPAAAAKPATLVKTEQLDPRLSELTFTTPALAAETHVRVLVPSNFDASGKTRYPVLYLLHGAIDDWKSWTDKGDAEAITKDAQLIVVMPDAGQFGEYTDWFNDGAFGPPEWETYHIDQLIPWIDAHYPTRARRGGRALAGLSMGGFGAMSYAARHPGLFVSASSFSGAVDTNSAGLWGVAAAGALTDGSHTPGAIFGQRATEEVRWHAHNPTDLAPNLEGLNLTLRTGNGQPGGPGGDSGDPIEAEVHTESVSMHDRLVQLGLPHVWDDYGAGGHAWFYWQRDLRETLPGIVTTFAHPPAAPSPFDFRAVEPSYSVYGWRVAIDRPALEFSELRGASSKGFKLLGSGTAKVRTARYYKPRSLVRVAIRTADGTKTLKQRAGKAGRVTVSVPIGTGNSAQEYSPEATASGTTVYAAKVTLRGHRLAR